MQAEYDIPTTLRTSRPAGFGVTEADFQDGTAAPHRRDSNRKRISVTEPARKSGNPGTPVSATQMRRLS
jgi:hypothetical protein